MAEDREVTKVDGRKTRRKAKGTRHRDKGVMPPEQREAHRQRMLKRWQDPAFRAKQAKYNDPKHNRRHRFGVPDGYTKETAAIAWAEARAKTEVYFQQMIDSGAIEPIKPSDVEDVVVRDDVTGVEHVVQVPVTDEGKAALALKECVLAMLSPMNDVAAKHAARRTVLEYTKAKPAQSIKATVSHEDFLQQVINDAKLIEHGDGN